MYGTVIKRSTHLYAKFMHLNNFANEISITALLLVFGCDATTLWLIWLLGNRATSVHRLSSTMVSQLSSGSGSSASSSSWASASKCDTIKWPEWMISFSFSWFPSVRFFPPKFRSDADDDVDVIGGDGADADVNQLSRSNCCDWCDMAILVLKLVFPIVSLFRTFNHNLEKYKRDEEKHSFNQIVGI